MKNHLTLGAVAVILLPFTSQAQAAREAMITAETTFATQVAQQGMKAAFLANCAPAAFLVEDGKLANAQTLLLDRPAQPARRLAWYPVLADVAQSGDLGYTTGPWTMMQNDQPQATGEYVTVWRKQPGGQWKFAVNMGIERVGTAPAKAATVLQPRLQSAAATPSAAPSYIVLDVDRKFNEAEMLKPGETYQQYLSAEARLYRSGLSMMQGPAATANMKNMGERYFFAPTTGYLAAAGDLGYVVGEMRRPANAKHAEETGTYLRIWRREAVAGWRLAAEVFNMVPAPAAVVPVAAPAASGGATTGELSSKSGQ